MCSVVAAYYVASTVLTAYSVRQQQVNNQAQADYQNGLMIRSADNAKQSMIDQTQQDQLRQQQEQAALSQKAQNVQIESEKKASTAQVAAGEAGVGGTAVSNLLADFHRQESRFIDTARYNNDMTLQQLSLQDRGIRSQAESRINSANSNLMAGPNSLASGLSIARAGMSAYRGYRTDTGTWH